MKLHSIQALTTNSSSEYFTIKCSSLEEASQLYQRISQELNQRLGNITNHFFIDDPQEVHDDDPDGYIPAVTISYQRCVMSNILWEILEQFIEPDRFLVDE